MSHREQGDRHSLPRVALTIGDPNGIGPEILLQLLADRRLFELCTPVVVGSAAILGAAASHVAFDDVTIDGSTLTVGDHTLPVVDIPVPVDYQPGRLSADAGAFSAEAVKKGARMVIDGECDALVTLPIAKQAWHLAGYDWPGHTEYLGELCDVADPLMVLQTEGLRVGLLTIHTPLRNVPNLISPPLIERRMTQFYQYLNVDCGLEHPSIALLGLNPHAGEGGSIGREEVEIYGSAIERLERNGMDISGPFPADGFFARYTKGSFNGVMASYHDQGLIPLKMMAGGYGVNVTAGLPIVRTSPDHGTAFDIAGKGVADVRSSREAVKAAVDICMARQRFRLQDAR